MFSFADKRFVIVKAGKIRRVFIHMKMPDYANERIKVQAFQNMDVTTNKNGIDRSFGLIIYNSIF